MRFTGPSSIRNARCRSPAYVEQPLPEECNWGEGRAACHNTGDAPVEPPPGGGGSVLSWEGMRMNKRKKVAWHKHLKARKKIEEKRKAVASPAAGRGR